MSKHIGRLQQVGIGKESPRGTAAVPTFWLKKIDFDFDDKFEPVIDESSFGVIEDAENLDVAKKWGEGQIGGNVGDASIGLLLLAALGTVNTADNADSDPSVKDHTFSVQEDAQHDSITIEAKNPNEQKKYANGVVQSLEFSVEQKDYMKFVANILARNGATAANSPSYTAENRFLGRHVNVKFATDLAGLAAAGAIQVVSASLQITKEVDHDDILGLAYPNDFLNKHFMVEGTIELRYNATTYKDLALAGTQKAMRIQAINTDVTIGSAAHPELRIDLAKVKLTEWSKSGGNNDIITETLKIKGLYDASETQMIEILLTNTQASY